MADTINEIASALGVDLLMPASFRGVEFDCLFTRDTLAKDTVTYAYPYRDGEEVEDQGLKAVNFRLQAIFWGNRYQTELKAFLNALKTAGTGELVHPVYGSVPDVQFLEAGVFHEVEPVNAVTVDLVFVESGKPDALFATTHYEADGDSIFDSAISWFGDAMDTLRDIQQDIARVTNIIASAEYVVNALANEVQSTIGSALDYLDYPTAFISDLKHLTGAFTERLSLSEASRLSDWNALTGLKNTMLTLPAQRTTAQQTMSSGSVKKVSIEPGDSAWDALKRVAEMSGLWPWMAPDGTLIIGGPDYSATPVDTLIMHHDGQNNNLLRLGKRTDMSGRYSQTTVLAQGHGTGHEDGKANRKCTVKDTTMTLYRPRIVVEGDSQSDEEVQFRARKLQADARLNGFALSATLRGFTTANGTLRAPGQRVYVKSDVHGVDDVYFIMRRTFRGGRGQQQETSLLLREDGIWLPDAYPKSGHRKGHRRGKKDKGLWTTWEQVDNA